MGDLGEARVGDRGIRKLRNPLRVGYLRGGAWGFVSELTRKKMGLLVDERTGEIFSALSFYKDLPNVDRNSTSNIGKVSGAE